GTSAIVHPAASLPLAAKRSGATVIEINPEETPLTQMADISVRAKSGEYLPKLVQRLKQVAPVDQNR
ncbi:MAG: NAD-dependent deacylase, partial [Candidatus Zixiibacteriota bacterium]